MAKEWYPIINRETCVNCLTCVEFCPHEVYEVQNGKPVVANLDNCVEFCQGCGKICPTGAIAYSGEN